MAEKIVEVDGKRYIKVKKGKYFNKKKSRKMKRHHPVRWILISAFCLLIVAPVGFIFGAFYDSSHKTVNDTYEKYDTHMIKSIASGLNDIGKNDGKFVMSLDEDFLNSLLVLASENLLNDPTVSQFVKNIYCDIDGTNYNFYVDLQASFFKTKIRLYTTLDYVTRDNSPTYLFKINNIVLGRLPLGNLAKSILPQFISDAQINSALKQTGLNLNFSLANMEMTYDASNMKTDLGVILEKFNTRDDFSLASVILELYDELDPHVTFNNGVNFSINLKSLTERPQGITCRNPLITASEEEEYKTLLDSYQTFVEDCLNKGYITTEDKDGNYNTLFKYLLTGYNEKYESTLFSSDVNPKVADLKTKIKTDLKVDDYTKHSGSKYLSGKKLDNTNLMKTLIADEKLRTNITTDEMASLLAGNKLEFCSISDSLLSNFLRSTDLMGYTFGFPLKIEDKYNFAYIAFDDFSVNIDSNELDIFGNVNFNGLTIPLTLANTITQNGKVISITPKDENGVLIGDIAIDSVKDKIFTFIAGGFASGDLFKFNKDHFELDFSTFSNPNAGEYGTITHFINAIIKGYYLDSEGDPQYTYTYSTQNFDLTKFVLNYTTNNGAMTFDMSYQNA